MGGLPLKVEGSVMQLCECHHTLTRRSARTQLRDCGTVVLIAWITEFTFVSMY